MATIAEICLKISTPPMALTNSDIMNMLTVHYQWEDQMGEGDD